MRSAHVAREDARGKRDSIDDEFARASAAREGETRGARRREGGGAREGRARAEENTRDANHERERGATARSKRTRTRPSLYGAVRGNEAMMRRRSGG